MKKSIVFHLQQEINALTKDSEIETADKFDFGDINTFWIKRNDKGFFVIPIIVTQQNEFVNTGMAFLIKENEQEIRQILQEAGCSEEEIEMNLTGIKQ